MPKPGQKTNAARKAKAAALNRFSVEVARLRTTWRWIRRDVIHREADDVDGYLAKADLVAFLLAQDIESGQVELDLPDEPRPLFDRPSKGDAHVQESIHQPGRGKSPTDETGSDRAREHLGRDRDEGEIALPHRARTVDRPQGLDRDEDREPGVQGDRQRAGLSGDEAFVNQAVANAQAVARGLSDALAPGGDYLVKCNGCDFTTAKSSGEPCPKGHASGFGYAGPIATDPPEPKRKPKKSAKAVDFDEDPTGEIAAHQEREGWRLHRIGQLDLPASTKKLLIEDFENIGHLSDAFERYEREAEGDDSFINRNLASARRQVMEAIAKFRKGQEPAIKEWIVIHHLAGGRIRENIGGFFTATIEEATEHAERLFGGKGGRLEILDATSGQAKQYLEEEQALELPPPPERQHYNPANASNGAGDSAEPLDPYLAKKAEGLKAIREANAKPKPARFLVKAAKGNPLYILTADSLEQATAYVRDQYCGENEVIEPIEPGGFPAKFPAWLTAREIPAGWEPGKKKSRKRKGATVAS
ncbi:hypothetical protein P12x_003016 [Tundrisphaera lichenicola]|uniref:hypothetical protein n=1 Tax=Tundrisphaera lichenicola TaxID=2029860 RepID=UPI003EB73F20